MKNFTAEISKITAAFEKAIAKISKAAQLRVHDKNLIQICALPVLNIQKQQSLPLVAHTRRNQ